MDFVHGFAVKMCLVPPIAAAGTKFHSVNSLILFAKHAIYFQ
jgi:hypothetical protein